MKILIIGSGFLGSAISERLESEGHDILVFSRTWNPKIHSRQVLGDIFNFQEFLNVLAWDPNVIIHTSWITTPGVYRNDYSNFRYADFTIKLAEFVADSKVNHLIILGTCAEYGSQTEPSTAGVTKVLPNNLYAKQKVHAFNSSKELLNDSDVRFTWARVFYPYGPNQNRDRLIPRLIDSLKINESVTLADISSIYDWITARDVASAVSWVMNNKLPMEIDIGTSIGYTNLEILTILEKQLQPTIQIPPQGNHDIGLNEVYVVSRDSSLLRSGWEPNDTLTSGLDWMLSQ